MADGPLRWADGALELLDQTRLPAEELWLRCERPEQLADAIRRLAVRGAPAIGVAAAYGLALGLAGNPPDPRARFEEVAALLGGTRPTAVNLGWAIERGRATFELALEDGRDPAEALLEWANDVARDQLEADRRMAVNAASLLTPGTRMYTHCNTGALATAGLGTAPAAHRGGLARGPRQPGLGGRDAPAAAGRAAHRLGARPRRRAAAGGHRLERRGPDGARPGGRRGRRRRPHRRQRRRGEQDRHLLAGGARRPPRRALPRGGAAVHDRSADAERRRHPDRGARPRRGRRPRARPLNYAFDVTPAELVSAIVTEAGVLRAPYEDSIAAVLAESSIPPR